MKVSFCHSGSPTMASYRYRAHIPAKEIGAEMNNPKADILVFSKPNDQDVPFALNAKNEGRKVIVDFCDMHFDQPHYVALLKLADAVVCPTEWFRDFLREDFGVEATVIGDPYEFPEAEPHCNGTNLLWYGHALNIDSLNRVLPRITDYPLRAISNVEGCIPYSRETMLEEMAKADIVIIPETAPYKSANRTIEAIRQGCFVVAEPHPAINEFPIWRGNIRKGIEWAQQNLDEANLMMKQAQEFIKKRYSPKILGDAWKTLIQKVASCSTSEAAA